MINLENLKYERPNLKNLIEDFKILLDDFKDSNSFKEANNLFIIINSLRSDFITLEKKSKLLGNIDNEEEISFFDENKPIYTEVETTFFHYLLQSKFREDLEEIWGSHIFNIASWKTKIFHKSIMEDLVKENKLISQYNSLIRDQIKLTPSELIIFIDQVDPLAREEMLAYYRDIYMDEEEELANIFTDLLALRTRMAQKLGFKNYLELGNLRHGRVDYFDENIKDFRKNMFETIQPIYRHILDIQKKNLGQAKIYYQDEGLMFAQANPKIELDSHGVLNVLRIFFGQVSPESKDYIETMVAQGLIDLEASQDQVIYLNNSKLPILRLKYENRFQDLQRLFAMIGVSLQYYMSSQYDIPDYSEMTTETKSALSKSMEYIGYSGISLMLGDNLNKYILWHLAQNFKKTLANLMVNEFEYNIYKNHNQSYDEIKDLWKKLELKYFPNREYKEGYLGVFWLDNQDIFTSPLTSIGEVIGQNITEKIISGICTHRDQAIGKYLEVCKIGGSKSIYEIMELSSIKHPLEDFPDPQSIIASIDRINNKIK